MQRRGPLDLRYDPAVREHLRAIEQRHHTLIRRTIEEQLQYEPERETRNRKPLQRPTAFGARWELRVGPGNRFRVFYRVDRAAGTVEILAIGVKDRNRLVVGDQEIIL